MKIFNYITLFLLIVGAFPAKALSWKEQFNLLRNPKKGMNYLQIANELKEIPFIEQKIAITGGIILGALTGWTLAQKAKRGILGGAIIGALIGGSLSLICGEAIIDKCAYGLAGLVTVINKIGKKA